VIAIISDAPEGWYFVPLLTLCEIVRGVSFDKGEAIAELKPHYVPLLRANNIGIELDINDTQYVPSSRVKPQQYLLPGDVVVAMSSGSKAVVGKGAQLKHEWFGTFGAFCGVIRPSNQINSDYFGLFFQTFEYRNAISESAAGTNINNLKRAYFAALNLPLPPLAEQRRIVAAVEALLTQVNAIRDRLNRVPTLLKRFRQAILAAACDGRLTEDWRRSNILAAPDINQLLQLRKAKHVAINNSRYKEPVNSDEKSELIAPDGWTTVSIDQITSTITSGSRDWTRYYGRGTGTFIMAQNVRPGKLDLTTKQLVDPPEGDRDSVRSQVVKGDLLVTIVGANTGDVCVVPNDLPEHYVCQSVALMRPVNPQQASYLNLYLNSAMHGKHEFERYIYGEGRPHLSFDQLRMTRVLLPPLPEQDEIVRRVNALFALADQIDAKLTRAKQRVDKLTQAILAKAFRGELVPTEAELARREGRTYETATELLARIQGDSPHGQAKDQGNSRQQSKRSTKRQTQ
jgi:type I restriction enzyme S subunit